jgi:hypothetical protein
MGNKHFERAYTVEAVKKLYKQLAFEFHPDLGGDVETMKAVNAEYHEKLRFLDGMTSHGSDGKEHQYRYSQTTEQKVIDKISELLGLRLPLVEIELIGTWIWITGQTREVKEQLKAAKCRYNSKRECWCWSPAKWRGRGSKGSLEDLACKYGSTTFSSRALPA